MVEATYDRFAYKTYRLKSGNFQVRSSLGVVDESQKRSNEVWPLIVWKLNGSDSSDNLRSDATRFRGRGAETDK
jgi:hypothetical protein